MAHLDLAHVSRLAGALGRPGIAGALPLFPLLSGPRATAPSPWPWPSPSLSASTQQARWSSQAVGPPKPRPEPKPWALASHLAELEADSSFKAPPLSRSQKLRFRPWKRAKDRKFSLPGSKWQYHPPRYNRGRLHPMQSPPSSSPVARNFIPGPFHLPRLHQTYTAAVAPDLMTLLYKHVPPGTIEAVRAPRLAGWDGSSPYHKNRPPRGPRGGDELPIVERDVDFASVPKLMAISFDSYAPQGITNSDYLIVARAALLAITGVMPLMTKTRKSEAAWSIREGFNAGVKATVYGNQAYDLLDRIIHIVLPRIREWPGMNWTTGDRSGGVALGLSPEQLAIFPEIELNYANYPPKMIPGANVFIRTTATSDRQAKLFMQAMGMPFADPDRS